MYTSQHLLKVSQLLFAVTLASKAIKMIYADTQEHGKQVEVVDIEESVSNQFSLNDDEVHGTC